MTRYAETYGLPATLLLAMLQAESDLNPSAQRWGAWPDVSGGLAQLTVQTAAAYGLGDGTPASSASVMRALMDRELSIDLGARHLRGCYDRAGGDWLQALICYNAGSPHPNQNDWYWAKWGANIRRYQDAIEWAKGITDSS